MSAEVGGYWLPHTSSVDFCEPNYFVSPYVVEFHNTWSSIWITILAAIGFFYGNPTNEFRFSVLYCILGVVGLGSTALHGTLHWFFQSADEVPMLWTSLALLYGLCVVNEEKKSPRSKTYAWIFSLVAIMMSTIYYQFQQIYAAFIITFLTSSLVFTIWTAHLAFFEGNAAQRAIRARCWLSGFLVFVIFGAGVWLIDFHMCDQLMPFYLKTSGFTLHVFWHFFSSFGTYIMIVFEQILRMQALKLEPQVDYIFLFIPICRQVGASNKLT